MSNITMRPRHANVSDLLFRTVKETRGVSVGSDQIVLVMEDGTEWSFYHEQDCCEYVRVEEVHGDPSDLVGEELLLAEESYVRDDAGNDLIVNTFYHFRTNKGTVTIRWLGESNGYYGVDVSFYQTK